MNSEILFRIVVKNPALGVDYALQEGKGSNFSAVQKQRSTGKVIVFDFKIKCKIADNRFSLLGKFVQGTSSDKFIYVDIGTFAGQINSIWSGRLKVPLTGITQNMIQSALAEDGVSIEATVPGQGKDGRPNYGTVKPFDGWRLKS
jgi:hypothetical protein